MKNRKEQFLEAVRILAPGNELFLKLASRVKEEDLPKHPGGVAIEFVATLEKVWGRGVDSRAERKARWAHPRTPQPRRGCRARWLAAGGPAQPGEVVMAA